MKVIALIPARGGSKGVPGKNIYPILGKPLINYSIEVALKSNKLSQVWVSSDAEDILKIAEPYNVLLHKREKGLSEDMSPIRDTIQVIFRLAVEADALLLLQPTSPIRTVKQIDECIDLLEANNYANSVISICAMDDIHPARMYWKNKAELTSILPVFEHTQRQNIPPAYYRNGSMYLVRKDAFMKTGDVMAKPSIGFEMPYQQWLNIDSPRDIIIAESLISAWRDGQL
jgi:CMP-N,N'-diacetyllegionaminic acid synthase